VSAPAWSELEALFHEAQARPAAERAAWLAERCAGRPDLRAQIEAMLRAHDEACGALDVSAMTTPAPLEPGTRLGVYEIAGPLGAGGMGEVYRARDTKLRRDVAIKILPSAFVADADRATRFEREARVLAALNHPHVAAIYGIEDCEFVASGISRTTRALVLELVEGETLADRIARGPVPVSVALDIARQIAEALEAAHEKGIVHRDLKPANIKVTPTGIVKVLDFGLAKTVVPAAGVTGDTVAMSGTGEGLILGTAAYMSPEQARGQQVDKRTDIWAFGCVLYETLSRRAAFPGETVSDTIATILGSEPDWHRLPGTMPAGIRRLLRRCLEKDSNRRLHDVADARIEIEDAIRSPGHDGAASQTGPPTAHRRERLAWTIAALAAGIAALALATAPFFREPAAMPAPTRFEIPTPPTVDPASFALSSDGRQLAFVATTDGVRRLFVRALDQVTARPLPGTEGALFPFWAPNGQAIGFFADLKLKRIDLPRGTTQVLADASGWGATWNADDVILFAPILGGPLSRISASGGDPVIVTPYRANDGDLNDCWPQFLPDGRRFLFFHVTNTSETTGVYVGSLDGSEPRRVLSAQTMAVYAPPGMLLQVRQETLMALPFDTVRSEVTGDPVPIAQGFGQRGFPPFRSLVAPSATGVLAYRGAGGERQRQLTWVDRGGVAQGTIGPPIPGWFISAELSPDGRWAAVDWIAPGPFRHVWLFDVRTGVPVRFTFDAKSDDSAAVWSPDGRRVIFTSNRNGVDDLFEKQVGGTTVEQPLLVTSDQKESTAVSNDGRFLLYVVRHSERLDADLWALPLTGDPKPFPVAQTSFQESSGLFSPDGKWVAYTSNESGRFEVYTQSFPVPGGKRQLSVSGGSGIRWSPDGHELFYVAADDRLMAVPITSGQDGQLEAGAAVPLFQTRLSPYYNQKAHYSVAADGRFLMNMIVESPQVPPITVVLNWQEELKQRVPTR
jgi:serine/threonine protein kinase/Tol biopolymer transport system component